MNSQTLEQKLAALESRCSQLEDRVKALEPKSKRPPQHRGISPVVLDELLSRHIKPSDSQTEFVSATEVVDYLTKMERLTIGYKSVAQSIQRLTGQKARVIGVKNGTKRGYCLKLG